MVFKAKKVIADGRLQFASHWRDVVNSFMAIRPKVTRSGQTVTFVASRSGDTGHADLAWATMHVLFNEALDPDCRRDAQHSGDFLMTEDQAAIEAGGVEVFTFGDPESVIDRSEFLMLEAADAGKYYSPPISIFDRSGQSAPNVGAPFERDHAQAQPAEHVAQTEQAAAACRVRKAGHQLSCDRQRLS